MVLEDIKRELLLFDKYIEFRFSIDCFDEIQLLDESSVDFKKLKLELYDKFVCRNNEKFVNEFNSRFNKYNIMRFILNYRGGYFMPKNDFGFCSGLKLGVVHILLETYRIERKSKKRLNEYIDYIKNNDLEQYNDFLNYKEFVEKRTPNLKELYYEFLDGKRETLDFELFAPV